MLFCLFWNALGKLQVLQTLSQAATCSDCRMPPSRQREIERERERHTQGSRPSGTLAYGRLSLFAHIIPGPLRCCTGSNRSAAHGEADQMTSPRKHTTVAGQRPAPPPQPKAPPLSPLSHVPLVTPFLLFLLMIYPCCAKSRSWSPQYMLQDTRCRPVTQQHSPRMQPPQCENALSPNCNARHSQGQRNLDRQSHQAAEAGRTPVGHEEAKF